VRQFVRLVRFLRVVRALRLFRVSKYAVAGDGVTHHIILIGTTLLTLVLVSACLFLYVETYDELDNPDRLQFHQASRAQCRP
jgi:hypothetical protein